jgi:hypothetical protein
VGAYAEASRILSDQQIKHSSALLQNAYLDILQWNYESAEKKLNEYLKSNLNHQRQFLNCLYITNQTLPTTRLNVFSPYTKQHPINH